MAHEPLVENMSAGERAELAARFLDHFLRGGFGAMTKREMEMLVFHCLEQTETFSTMTFYERANALRVLESRIKSLKANSTQRYAQLDNKSAIRQLAVGIARDQTIAASYEDGKIVLVIEDPALRRELEHTLRALGGRVDYTLNRDVVSVQLPAFIALLRKTLALGDEDLAKRLAMDVKDAKASKKLLAAELPLVDRVHAFLEDKKGIASAIGALLSGIAKLHGSIA
jgi:hypothetical protein